MSETSTAQLEPVDQQEYVRRALVDVRMANARAVAWLRVAVRVLLLVVFGATLLFGVRVHGVDPLSTVAISAVHLAAGIAILLLFLRRPSEGVAALGAASDFASLFAGAWLGISRSSGDPELVAAVFLGGFALVLLMTALTLPRRALPPLAAVACLFEALTVWRAGLSGPEAVTVIAVLVAFSVALPWAGAHLVAMATRAAAEAYAAFAARRHADELRSANEALREAQATAELLTVLIVHDLRNPLASIWANLEAVRAEIREPSASCAQALDVASEELQRLTDMIRDLLLVTRLEEGLRPARGPVPVAALLQGVERATAAVAARVGARLTVRAPAGLDASLDESLVRRLLENLVANAIRHMKPGDHIELAGEVEGDRLRLAVRNSGPPVPPEVRDRLFEKYAAQGQRYWHNAGLGLYLCRLVAEGHGGTIGLVERPGWSVAFEAELPLSPPAA
jgi:signal transduction histidine kinase